MAMLLRVLLSHYRRHPVQALFLLSGIVLANVLLVGTLPINAQAREPRHGATLLQSGPVGEIRHRTLAVARRARIPAPAPAGFDMLAPALRQVVTAAKGTPELLGIDCSPCRARRRNGGVASSAGFAGFAFPPWQCGLRPAARAAWLARGRTAVAANGAALPPLMALPGKISAPPAGHRGLTVADRQRGTPFSLLVFPATGSVNRLAERAAGRTGVRRHEQLPDPAELTRSFHLNLAAMGLLASW
jgi:putative ABC transport system permease protein